MNGEFDRATAVRHLGEGSYAATVTNGWDIAGNANGGFLMAICGRAMADHVGRPPLTVTAHFLAPAPTGPCTVEVDTVRDGRRLATANATMRQDGRDVMRLLGTFGHQIGGRPDDRHRQLRPSSRRSTNAWSRVARPTTSHPFCSTGSRSGCAPVTTGSGSASRRGGPRSPVGSRSPTASRSTPSPCSSSPTRSRRRCSTRPCRSRGCRPSS